jgi:hypothetical protein
MSMRSNPCLNNSQQTNERTMNTPLPIRRLYCGDIESSGSRGRGVPNGGNTIDSLVSNDLFRCLRPQASGLIGPVANSQVCQAAIPNADHNSMDVNTSERTYAAP